MRNATRNAFVFLLVALVAIMGSTHEASSAFAPTPSGTGVRWVTGGKENAAARSYFTNGTDALAATTGVIRLPEEPTGNVVMAGLSSGVDYQGIGYSAGGAAWHFGNGSQYTYVNGYQILLTSTYPATVTDTSSGTVNWIGEIAQSLNADFTTTANTATSLNITFNATAGEKWDLDFWCTCMNASGGIKFSIVAPATSTVEGWLDSVTTTAILLSRQRFTAINTLNTTATNTGVNVPAITRITATLDAIAGGAVSIGVASVTAGQTTTVRKGSGWRARRSTPL